MSEIVEYWQLHVVQSTSWLLKAEYTYVGYFHRIRTGGGQCIAKFQVDAIILQFAHASPRALTALPLTFLAGPTPPHF